MRILIRKILVVIGVFSMSLLVSSFSSKAHNMTNLKENLCKSITSDENCSSNQYLSLDKLPKYCTYDLAIGYGDVIGRWVKGHNIEELNDFIKSHELKTLKIGDIVRITPYTVEGEAIIRDLIFTKEGLKLIKDSIRDYFSNQEVLEYTISNIIIEIRGLYIRYFAKTASSEKLLILSIDALQ